CTASDCAVKLGKLLNVGKMVVGEYTLLGTSRFLTASLVDVETSRIERSAKVKGFDVNDADVAADNLVAQLFGDAAPATFGDRTPVAPRESALASLKALKSPAGAFFRSLVLPGWGQHYNGQRKTGYFIQSLWLIGVGTAVTGFFLYDQSLTADRIETQLPAEDNLNERYGNILYSGGYYYLGYRYDDTYLFLGLGGAAGAIGVHLFSLIAAPVSSAMINSRIRASADSKSWRLATGFIPLGANRAGLGGSVTFEF
ncbi:MAG: hypothetical protein AAB368_10805, partial [bacterium]